MKKITVIVSLTLLLAALVTPLAAGCGGGSQPKQQLQDYVTACRPNVERVNAAFADIGPVLQAISPAKDATWAAAAEAFTTGAAASNAAAGGFKAIVPPEQLKPTHDQLVGGLGDLGKALAIVGKALADGTFTQKLLNGIQVGQLLDSGNKARTAWKSALEQQCKKLGVTIPWKWQ